MKNLFTIISIILIGSNVISQNLFKSGEITYNIKPLKLEENSNHSKESPMVLKFKKILNSVSEKLKYNLKFNKSNSTFYLESNLPIDSEDRFTKLALTVLNSESKFYHDGKTKKTIEEKFSFGEDFLIKIPESYLQWELINEQKVIGKYTCYKAKTRIRNAGPVVEGRDMFSTVIAWYCPSIPFNYGPMEFNNLPGLILELSIKSFTYVASTIKLSKEEMKLDNPRKGKFITKEEYEEIGRKAFENR